MAGWGRICVSGWAAVLIGSCAYDSASLDADPFDGLTVLPRHDAGPRPEVETGDTSDAGAARPDASVGDAVVPDGGEPRQVDASMPVTRPEPDASAPLTRPDAGSVTPDASAAVAPVDAGSTDPSSYSCAELTYESFGRAFMKRYCNDCHSVQKPTLLTLETVALNKDVVRQTTVTTQRMPLKSGAVPTLAQRVQLGVWLDCGPY